MAINRTWEVKHGATGEAVRGRLKGGDGEWINFTTWGDVTLIVTEKNEDARLVEAAMTKEAEVGWVNYSFTTADFTALPNLDRTYDVEIVGVNPAGNVVKFPGQRGVPFGELVIPESK